MKRLFVSALSLLIASAALAATGPLYRIALSDGSEVLSQDRPAQRGSVLTFHAYPGGTLTGVPQEEVVAVTAAGRTTATHRTFNRTSLDKAVVEPSSAHELAPGEVIYLGPTGGGAAPTEGETLTATQPPSIPGGVYDPRMAIYGGYGGPRTAPAPGTAGDLARAISAPPPTDVQPLVGANGFPGSTSAVPVDANGFRLTIGGTTAVDENGFAMAPGTATPVIGPDGQPVLGPTGAASPTIGANGTPVMVPPGTPGSAPPTIGPNGTPVLAPLGTPGSAQPVVGPNGYPSVPAVPPHR
ncbi:MAG TPA: hypothetical protein VKE50_08410 [Thermoanaerobaculia bacterium]|nr:hypothetical protein [Thermoanaerobaculia bacterium]